MDNLTKDQRHKNMVNIRSKNTAPELFIRNLLRNYRINFTQHLKTLPGKPDFVLKKQNLVLFVDSDFWHGNPRRFIMPATNINYWKTKIERNRARDKEVNKLLKSAGWRVLRVWEYDIKHYPDKVAHKILNTINSTRCAILAKRVNTRSGLISQCNKNAAHRKAFAQKAHNKTHAGRPKRYPILPQFS